MVLICNISTQKAKVGRSQVLGQHSLEGRTSQSYQDNKTQVPVGTVLHSVSSPSKCPAHFVSMPLHNKLVTLDFYGEEECPQKGDGTSMGQTGNWSISRKDQVQPVCPRNPCS